MFSRFLCPHCRCSIDPRRVEAGADGANEYRICPECDEAFVVVSRSAPAVPEDLCNRRMQLGVLRERAPVVLMPGVGHE